VQFSASVIFIGGHILQITDNFSRKSSSSAGWTRKFSYFFGKPNADEMERIFLFDTHGLYGAEGHRHLDNNERLLAGDPRLNGFSPDNIDIIDICGFLDLYFDEGPFPWDVP
jgi:hypothetical protein